MTSTTATPPTSKVYRLTRSEAAAFLAAAETVRERRIAHIGICAGARNGELRGLQGRHFQRAGWVWISADIAKGGRQRWVPVLPELEPIVHEIRETVAPDEYVIPAQRWRDPGANSCRGDLSRRPSSSQALRTAVMELAVRAGIHAHVHPHLMRHAFGVTSPATQGSRMPRRCSDAPTSAPRRFTRARRRWTSWRPRSRASGSPPKPTDVLPSGNAPRKPARGADRNRTGVHGFAGRCVTPPPRRREGV